MVERLLDWFRLIDRKTINAVWRVGAGTRFLILFHSGISSRRFGLTIRKIFSGVLSTIIIVASGLFVGMVLALQVDVGCARRTRIVATPMRENESACALRTLQQR